MKWPWRHPDLNGGAAAHRAATEHLAEANAQWPEVRRVSKSLRELRERNHFALQIQNIFEGGRRRER